MDQSRDPSSNIGEPLLEKETKPERFDRWVELASVIMLAVASLAAAWSGYQANLWGGVQAAKYSQASAQRIEATQLIGVAQTKRQIDISVYMGWLNAFASGNTELAEFYQARFTDRLAPAFDAWFVLDPELSDPSSGSPFDRPEYVISEFAAADSLEQDAAVLFEEGQAANKHSDNFVGATVLLATVLFFCGISPRIDGRRSRLALVSVAGLLLLVGLYQVVVLPTASISIGLRG